MITHDGAWNLWLLIFFLPFWKQTRNGWLQRLQWSSWAPLRPQMNHLLLGLWTHVRGFLRKVSVGQERYWNMNKWWINGSSETWNFLLWKKLLFSQRISALGFSTFLHVSPNELTWPWRLRFFNSPLQGIMNRVLPLQPGIQKSFDISDFGKLVQSVSWCQTKKDMMCFIWYTCVNIQFLALSIFIL